MIEGWISLHRKLQYHWVWSNPEYLKQWIDILLTVNHHDDKIVINGTLYDCKRGQSVRSQQTWFRRWNTTSAKGRRFLELLIEDEMITMENLQKTTRLTVLNYESYQDTQQTERKLNTTNNKVNKENKILDKNKKYLVILNEVIDMFPERTRPVGDFQVNKWLGDFRLLIEVDGYTKEDIVKAIKWARNDDFWRNNFMTALKLRKKNKEGVMWMDWFMSRLGDSQGKQQSQKTEPVKNKSYFD